MGKDIKNREALAKARKQRFAIMQWLRERCREADVRVFVAGPHTESAILLKTVPRLMTHIARADIPRPMRLSRLAMLQGKEWKAARDLEREIIRIARLPEPMRGMEAAELWQRMEDAQAFSEAVKAWVDGRGAKMSKPREMRKDHIQRLRMIVEGYERESSSESE